MKRDPGNEVRLGTQLVVSSLAPNQVRTCKLATLNSLL